MPGDSENANSSDSDSEELFSDNPKNNSEAYTVVQSKRNANIIVPAGQGRLCCMLVVMTSQWIMTV